MWSWVRNCGRCGKYSPPVDLYCEKCWRRLNAKVSFQQRTIENKKVFSLWSWAKTDKDIGQFILDRKNKVFERAHQRVAAFLPTATPAPWTQVVYPNHEGKRDHATVWANAVAQKWGLKSSAIDLPRVRGYKNMGRKDRQKQRSHDSRSTIEAKSQETYCFVDDVYTTGATAEAAWNSLGRPINFDILVMVYRREPGAT